MTTLIWMLTWLPHVLPAMNELPHPININLTSSHFSHMLKWEPGPGTPTGVYYRISVSTETGTSWVPVAGCERVQHPLVCNLTDAFSNPEEVYFTQVTALLEAQASQPVILPQFQPINGIHLDLPLLAVTPCDRDLCVDLEPPMEHLRQIYDSLHYKLRIQSNSMDRAPVKEIKSLRRETLKHLAPGRQYCVSVCFSDSLVPRECNYSQPKCAITPGFYTADPFIAATLSLLVMSVMVIVALLVHTGFICLKRPLPLVLTSIHNIEEVLVIAPCSTTMSPFLNFKPTLPPSGEKRSSQTSDESNGQSVTESTDGSREGGYKLQVGPNLLSSSSSSSSLSAPLFPESEPPPSFSSNEISDFFNLQPSAALNHTLSPHIASHSDSLPEPEQCTSDPCPADTDSLTVGKIKPNEEEKQVVGDMDSQDVNLLTLTFGRHEEEEGKSHFDMLEVDPKSSSASEVYNTSPTLPSQTLDTKKVDMETFFCPVNEEEEEEGHSGYMGRP